MASYKRLNFKLDEKILMSVLNQDSIKEIYSEIRLMGIRYAGMLNKVHQLSSVLKEEKAKEYLSHGVGRSNEC